ncbi:MAG TPA: protocatechuate 3,4-dioxygenase subunit beta [Candidatus Dormibacteraeota bacterium]
MTTSVDQEPPYLYPDYVGTRLRAPRKPLVRVPAGSHDFPAPMFPREISELGNDLTRQHSGEPLGERIIVTGRVLDSDGRPIKHTVVEIWQANAAGRYLDQEDQHPAPLDPNFSGAGRCLTDGEGHYQFVTIKPGAYPWLNHQNAWRPAHIHFSLLGQYFRSRLVTQMYFPGDPLMPKDPILQSIPDPAGRERLVSSWDPDTTVPQWALGYRWDIVLRGREATPFEEGHR